MNIIKKLLRGFTNNDESTPEIPLTDDQKNVISSTPTLVSQKKELDDIELERNQLISNLETLETKRKDCYIDIFNKYLLNPNDEITDSSMDKELKEQQYIFNNFKDLNTFYKKYMNHPKYGKLIEISTMKTSENEYPKYFYGSNKNLYFKNNNDDGIEISTLSMYLIYMKKNLINKENIEEQSN
jgi:hypothetical protein